ncbi:Patatin-like phospholipase [Nitrosomonas marina]|uniref:Patatin-like phospholipase n=1 Tax=Nitrosomonas marina TaxID=917 RepID=A0A1I0CZD3_9PROT|nr:patatin-like phospholipase family protein [Nitrosomonas marina]SET25151.1 Patatin-like phospholipase [Nitrosomonas marina]
MRPRYVLSLDGGGSHLLIQLSVLACLEEDTGASTYDLFDMIAGSSSGGMLACLISGRMLSASGIIRLIQQDKLLENMMTGHWLNRLLNTLQIRPKYTGISKRRRLKKELGGLRLSSLDKQVFVPCFNLDRDQLEIFTNQTKPDFLLCEIADACTAAPAYYPPVRMEDNDWRIDGGVGMNNPGLGAYLHARQLWAGAAIKMLSVGSGWRSFSFDGQKACRYGGMQWSAKGIASVILREKMMANVKLTEAVIGEHALYINEYLKHFGLPDHMDSVNDPVNQRKALEIGRLWYDRHREKIRRWIPAQNAGHSAAA